MSSLQFWLSFNNGAERLQLPVNPERIDVSSTHGYEDIEIAQLGEITVIGNAKLRGFSFSSFFPRDYNASYCEYENIPNPWDAVQLIERWKLTRRPIRLTITGTSINEAVTIRSFDYDEHAGSPGDIYFNLSLKEYVFVEIGRVKKTNEVYISNVMSVRHSAKEKLSTYVIRSGDSLWKIAKVTLGNGDRWREIYEKNKSIIGPNPNLIRPGQTLVIP